MPIDRNTKSEARGWAALPPEADALDALDVATDTIVDVLHACAGMIERRNAPNPFARLIAERQCERIAGRAVERLRAERYGNGDLAVARRGLVAPRVRGGWPGQ